jgi:Raf kinase inhibitor-like YbhB/YbcL family protein/uncharacterized protein (TIGR00297 family)
MLTQFLLGFLLAVLVSFAAYRAHSLSRSGALAALGLGTVIFGLGGWGWAILLLGFFISSSGLSCLARDRKQVLDERFSKGSQRDAGQVLANGGVAGLCVVLNFLWPQSLLPWLAFASTLAAVNADTWSTELGVLGKSNPRLITTGKPVERGASGGISLMGTLAALGGALFIALLMLVVDMLGLSASHARPYSALLLVTLAGVLGSLFDSLLGASVQAIYFCPSCCKETERHPRHTCGSPTTLARGWPWLNNDGVNTACAALGALLVLAAGFVFPVLLGPNAPQKEVNMSVISISSPAFRDGDTIPRKFSCDGDNVSPALSWSGIPGGARSLALIADDPDAPMGTFTHWVIYNLPPGLTGLPEGIAKTVQVTGGGTQGSNSASQTGYFGPCPPPGKAHRYFFKLYALDLEPALAPGLNAAKLQQAMQGHILVQGQWMGKYQR